MQMPSFIFDSWLVRQPQNILELVSKVKVLFEVSSQATNGRHALTICTNTYFYMTNDVNDSRTKHAFFSHIIT